MPGMRQRVGSISGQVTSNGQPVAMASVVAITPAGPGISTLTRPDGTYRIDGLAPGRYWVYVHPLPPDANIRGPYDPTGQTIPWSGPFETLFYPGTRDPQQFTMVPVDRECARHRNRFLGRAAQRRADVRHHYL